MLKQFYFYLSIFGQSSCEIEMKLKNRINNTGIFNIFFAFEIKDALKLKNDKEYIKVFRKMLLN